MTTAARTEGEAEVDFGRYATAVAARWWLLLLGLAAGILVALLISVGGKDVYRASALLYPGQPLSPSGSRRGCARRPPSSRSRATWRASARRSS